MTPQPPGEPARAEPVPGTGRPVPTPAAVSEIFHRVLDLGGIHAGSDFFDLGGDSLLATRVLSAVAREYGVELTLDDLVLAPTPAGLANMIASGSRCA
jgi:acyl carrier protein